MVHVVYDFTQTEIDNYAWSVVRENVPDIVQAQLVFQTLRLAGIEFCLNKEVANPQIIHKVLNSSRQ